VLNRDLTPESKYNQKIDRRSAHEMLTERLQQTPPPEIPAKKKGEASPWAQSVTKSPLAKQIARTLVREVTRAIMGAFGIKSSRRRK